MLRVHIQGVHHGVPALQGRGMFFANVVVQVVLLRQLGRTKGATELGPHAALVPHVLHERGLPAVTAATPRARECPRLDEG